MLTRSTFPLVESARVLNGALIVMHGPNCATRSGGECGCLPTYRLQRTRTGRRGR